MIKARVNPNQKKNEDFYNILNYELVKKNFENVRFILQNAGSYGIDSHLARRIGGLFLLDGRCIKWFGLSEAINQSTVNMAFSGNVNIRIADDRANALVEHFIFDSRLIETLKEAYSCALSSVGEGKAYILMKTTSVFDLFNNYKINDEFLEFEVLKQYEVEHNGNVFKRNVLHEVIVNADKKDKKTYEFVYTYTVNKGKTTLIIRGYDEEGVEISTTETKNLLNITQLVYEYDYVPFFELNIGRGQLSNAIFIEDSLAKNLYFKDLDLKNSQNQRYVPETSMFKSFTAENAPDFDDPYSTTHVMKQSVDAQTITIVEGNSKIKELQDHIKTDILQGCLDAKISPISLGYSLLDSMANNTDTPTNKERVSIRLREAHVGILKVLISKIIKTFLQINKIMIEITDIAVIFDPYITPSVESLTNVLSKQVQFGIKSRYRAIADLNKNEMSDVEIEEEYERVKELSTQKDFANTENKQEIDEKEKNKKDEIGLKVDNVLKSDGIVE